VSRLCGRGHAGGASPRIRAHADFTYIWTAEGWLYVAAVIDLFSRRVVGWSMSATMTAQLVADALMMAIWRRGKPAHCCITRIREATIAVSSFRSCWQITASVAA